MLKGGTDLRLGTQHNRGKTSPACSNSSLLPLRLLPHPLTFRPETRGGRARVTVDGTGLTPPAPEAHRISITTLHPRNVLPPPPRAGKHTSPTPEPTAGTRPPSPHGSAKFRVGGRLGTPAHRHRPGSGKLFPAAPELRQPRGRRAPPRPGPQPPRRPPCWPRPPPAPAGLCRPEFTSEARPRAAGSARRARPPVSAGTSPPPAAAEDERGRGRKARAREGRVRVYWLRAPPPAPPTAAAERRVAVRAAAVATDATGNECTAAPRLSGGQTSFGLEHPERHRTRK